MELAHRLLVLAVEEEELADSLGLVASRVPGWCLSLQGAGQDPDVSQPADERVGGRLENARDERATDRHRQLDFLALGVANRDLVEFGRRGQVVHYGVDQGANTDVLRRTADQDRRHHAGPDGLVQAGLQLCVAYLLALEVLGHHVVVGLGRGFEKLVSPQRDFVGQVGRHRDFDFLAALDLVGLAVD